MSWWGCYALLDPLWSTERLTFNHHGCEATRAQKLAFATKYQVALDNLRVCWKTKDGYNCGECEKCIRTMINLIVAGTLEKCATFPHEVTPEMLRSALIGGGNQADAFSAENLVALREKSLRPDLQSVLVAAMDRDNNIASIVRKKIKDIDDVLLGGIVRRALVRS